MTDKPTVLFVCVHNAGRSQMAAGYLRALGGDDVEVLSAGSAPKDEINPVAIEAMAEEGIDIAGNTPKILTVDAVKESDVVITMGCGDACPIFPGKRYEDWELDDPAGQGIEAVRPIRDEIRAPGRVSGRRPAARARRRHDRRRGQGALLSPDSVLHRAAERLAHQFAGMVSEETVERVVFESYTALARTAAVPTHLPCWRRSSPVTA